MVTEDEAKEQSFSLASFTASLGTFESVSPVLNDEDEVHFAQPNL